MSWRYPPVAEIANNEKVYTRFLLDGSKRLTVNLSVR
jgi:hypothetical protein